ncbi:ABC transporter permease [Maribellus maritimus]|uniref:ABC transporter permease n=1 Tax=Maribellus maritimus TaxID=2870838 RepID=UPI001EECD88E|nr:ABC transporter permease [Maribellus maritimus]MCG6189785.1 ABC transporter permease [Maribellus maritimus]
MIQQFLRLIIRIFRRNISSSLTNVISIAIGMSAFILVMLWVNNELSFDKFNEKREQIYRITSEGKLLENDINDATTGSILSKALPDLFPEVKEAVGMLDFGTAMMSKPDGQGFRMKVSGATASLFDVFSFPVIQGDNKSLEEPNTAFITQSAAKRIYGDQNPVGKILSTGMDHENKQFTITGVIADVPSNSHFTFDFLFSLPSISFYRNATGDWMNSNIYTYILLDKNTDYLTFESKLNEYLQTEIAPILANWRNLTVEDWKAKGESWRLKLQPLSKIHLYSTLKNEAGQNGNITYIYMALVIGLFILIISLINFTNLSTVQSSARVKEITVKKVTGASRKSIMWQFIAESCTYSFLALIISLAFVRLFIPVFEKNTEIQILSDSGLTPIMYLCLVLFAIFTGIVAGLYPAFVVSGMSPIKVLTTKFSKKNSGKLSFKDALLVLQFTISILVIISTFAVTRQLDFLQNKKLGFKKENIVVIRQMADLSYDKQKVFKEELQKNSNILTASFSHRIPGMSLPARNFAIPDGDEIEMLALETNPVEASFFETYKIELAKGDFFTDDVTSGKKMVLNEKALKTYNIQDPIGKHIYYTENDYYEVVGVIKDFHYNSKRTEVRAAAFVQEPDVEMWWSPEYLSVGIAGADKQKIINYIKTEHQKVLPGKEFVFSFFDEDYDALYKNEYQTKQLFTLFALIAICLSCLGLFGLVKYIVMTKVKEIGIRKVSGAGINDILIMLSGSYIKWVSIAFIIATPVSYYAMHKWLENFAYKTNLSWWIFAFAGLLAMGIALLTVSWQSWRAATRNPVEALRYE